MSPSKHSEAATAATVAAVVQFLIRLAERRSLVREAEPSRANNAHLVEHAGHRTLVISRCRHRPCFRGPVRRSLGNIHRSAPPVNVCPLPIINEYQTLKAPIRNNRIDDACRERAARRYASRSAPRQAQRETKRAELALFHRNQSRNCARETSRPFSKIQRSYVILCC